jgi:hypothetical protein
MRELYEYRCYCLNKECELSHQHFDLNSVRRVGLGDFLNINTLMTLSVLFMLLNYP